MVTVSAARGEAQEHSFCTQLVGGHVYATFLLTPDVCTHLIFAYVTFYEPQGPTLASIQRRIDRAA